MAAAAPTTNRGRPAQLGFIAIYNPSLGNTDETIDDQIVYYASSTTQFSSSHARKRERSGRPTQNISPEERNERLRQIGLAQGMVHFGRDFSEGAAVDTIDTEKSRVVLRELEPGWWILASIDLTQIPLPPRLRTKSDTTQEEQFEYSSKELKPATLLLRDLLRAHGTFLLHHDSSLSALFVRNKRSKFVTVLSRYWDLFLSTWNVMLHGNPIRDVFGNINLAASGELGIGVGEEGRGSGERAVLEGLVGRVEGLVDLVVSKFGDEEDLSQDATMLGPASQEPWLGGTRDPGIDDGAIFLGTGSLSRKSLCDITHWMEDLYIWGDHAYGMVESPTSVRRGKTRRSGRANKTQIQEGETRDEAANPVEPAKTPSAGPSEGQATEGQDGKMEKMVNYLKLGYGSYWTIPGVPTGPKPASPALQAGPQNAPKKEVTDPKESRPKLTQRTPSAEAVGHYLIGLKGEIEEAESDQYFSGDSADLDASSNSRTVLRTVNVELDSEALGRPEATITRDFQHPANMLTQSQIMGNLLPGYNSHDLNKAKKLRVVVYVNRPFIFVFLFQLRTDSLAWDSMYRSLHHQLAPLKKSLLASTKYRPERPDAGQAASSIYNLVWDPKAFTVQSTVPNIPETYSPEDSWSRADALNTHLHLLNIHNATRGKSGDVERTQKTNRGWWIVWTRRSDDDESTNPSTPGNSSPSPPPTADVRPPSETGSGPSKQEQERERLNRESTSTGKEIFLVRKASDHSAFNKLSTYGEATGFESAGRLVQGIGVDTRRYVEELLTLL